MRTDKQILIVEDNAVDVMTIKRAFKELDIKNPIHHAGNGEMALSFLKENKTKPPCLILLDLNMSTMSSLEFLKEIKQDDKLKMIPVVLLTTTKEGNNKLESFKNGAAGHMIKPVDYNKFVDLLCVVKSYWSASELPSN